MEKPKTRISVPLTAATLAKLAVHARKNKRKIGPQAALLIEAGLQ